MLPTQIAPFERFGQEAHPNRSYGAIWVGILFPPTQIAPMGAIWVGSDLGTYRAFPDDVSFVYTCTLVQKLVQSILWQAMFVEISGTAVCIDHLNV